MAAAAPALVPVPVIEQALLQTPLDIYEATTPVFRHARLSIFQESPLIVDLELTPQIPTVRLISGVNRLVFVMTIQECAMDCIIAKRHQQPYHPAPLDPARFSVPVPLSNWKQFRRVMYEREGKVCEDVIRDYLRQPAAGPIPDELQRLGFAPAQVEGREIAEADAKYFMEAIKGLVLSGPHEDPMVRALKIRYPAMVRCLATREGIRAAAMPPVDSFISTLNILRSRVLGQDIATKLVATTLLRTRAHENTVFLFVGPTGIGKTELAKAAASLRLDKLKRPQLITFHMNQFPDEMAVSTFFGSAAGYVGSTSKPQIAMELEKFPSAIIHSTRTSAESTTVRVGGLVLLFDEFEKAHPILQQSLLTFFDEGQCVVRYTDPDPHPGVNIKITYELENCIIICSSNLLQDVVLTGFQHRASV